MLDGIFYVESVVGTRDTPGQTEALVLQTAETDTRIIPIRQEREPGASGVIASDHYQRRVLLGYDFRSIRSTGSKAQRAGPVSSAAQAGNIKLVRGHWNEAFLDEVEAFTGDGKLHDDQVDALSGAHSELSGKAEWGAV